MFRPLNGHHQAFYLKQVFKKLRRLPGGHYFYVIHLKTLIKIVH